MEPVKIFITRVIPSAGIKRLEEQGYQLTQWTEKRSLSTEELVRICRDHHALLSAGGSRLDASFFSASSHLKAISLYSAGYDHVDIAAATAAGIPVGHTPGVLSGATADVAFLLILAVSRNAFYMHRQIERNGWNFYDPTANLGIEISGKTLGIFGLGRIGTDLARKCRAAYGMKIIYHNRRRNEAAEKELGAAYVSMDELLEQSDVLSVHANLSPELKGVFNEEAFRKMKPSAIFINTARGGIHNETDLAAALKSGVIWGAGLDVTDPEPMQGNNELLYMPNVCVLPHIGSATVETRDAMALMAADNLIAAIRGEEMPHCVNCRELRNADRR